MESSATPRHQVLAPVAKAPRVTKDPRMRISVERLEVIIEPPFRTRGLKIRMTSDLLVGKRDYHRWHARERIILIPYSYLL